MTWTDFWIGVIIMILTMIALVLFVPWSTQ